MTMRDDLLTLIEGVVDEINERREEKIPTTDLPNVVLYGDRGVFDSMHLVNFLVLVEEALEDELGAEVSLTSEKAVSRRVSPFGSVARLVAFVEEELDQLGVLRPGSAETHALATA